MHWVVRTPEGIFEPESTSRQRVQQNKFCCIPGPKGTFFSIYILENAQRHWNKSLPGEQQEPVVASVFWGLTRDKTCCPIRHSLGLQEKVQLNYNSASLSFCLACLTANPGSTNFCALLGVNLMWVKKVVREDYTLKSTRIFCEAASCPQSDRQNLKNE